MFNPPVLLGVIDFCHALQANIKQGEPLEILISSGGGSSAACTSMLAMMRTGSQGSVLRTIGTGFVASNAVPLLASGTKGERYILDKDSTVMVHQIQYTFDQPRQVTLDIEAVAKHSRHKMDNYIELMAKMSGRKQA